MDKIIRRYNIYRNLKKKGLIKEMNKDFFIKSINELNIEKLQNEKERLENKLLNNIQKLNNK
ncbi:hypothetical protein [Tenacibaculum sp. C7A-26P2]|uniref:hypothetical protein n=1 Tax=Tenacibaculum sp. C7A-26P2 TaxID=3447504 RepID=UPI003F879E4F